LISRSEQYNEFVTAVTNSIDILQVIANQYSKHQIIVSTTPGSLRYAVHLPCGVNLNFLHISPVQNCKNSLFSILNNFDMDLCQVAFTGN
jgi:hypothetical protein